MGCEKDKRRLPQPAFPPHGPGDKMKSTPWEEPFVEKVKF